jgi:hypothetical protein
MVPTELAIEPKRATSALGYKGLSSKIPEFIVEGLSVENFIQPVVKVMRRCAHNLAF